MRRRRFFSYVYMCNVKNFSYIDVRPSTPCLEAEAYVTGQIDCGTIHVQTVLLGAVCSHVPARPATRQNFSFKGSAGWEGIVYFQFSLSGAYLTV